MTRASRLLFFSVFFVGSCGAAARSVEPAVLVMFSSPTCGPCQQMKPALGQLAAAGYQVRQVDVSQQPQLARRYGVEAWPTFLVLIDGQERARAVGARSIRDLEQMIQTAAGRAASAAGLRGQSPDNVQLASAERLRSRRGTPAPAADQPQAGRIVDLEQAGMAPPAPKRRSDFARLLAASVRISVEDAQGHSRGTGTLVDARSGEALILTCGHIFRESQGRGQITVSLFAPGPDGAVKRTEAVGTLVHYDLDRDLGLVSIRPDVEVQPARIAASDNSQPGAPVTTVGCNPGANPTAVATQVTARNRYQGHANIEAAGAPVEGRSGGGLFNARGELIGVCFAADPAGDEGLYVGLESIHAKLNERQLSTIYRRSANPDNFADKPWPDPVPPATPDAIAEPAAIRGQEPFARSAPAAVSVAATTPAATATVPTASAPAAPTETAPAYAPAQAAASAAAPQDLAFPAAEAPTTAAENPASSGSETAQLSSAEQATLEEIRRRGAKSEVICIIRPQMPGGKSEVISLTGVSPAFVEALVGGAKQ